MKKALISAILIASLLLLNSCNTVETVTPDLTEVTAGSEATTDTDVSDVTEDAEVSAETGDLPSSYSLIDEGYVVPVVNQSQGTCWANAGAEIMRYDLMARTGNDLNINVNDLVQISFSADPEEGIEGNYTNNRPQVGGSHVLLVSAVSTYDIDGYIMTEANDYSLASREVLQEKLMSCGALSLAITWDQFYYDSIMSNDTLNIPDEEFSTTNHMVTIVGWDNDFPADEFDPPASSNGAWRVQDSAGTVFGDGGFYWLSYDSPLYGVCDFQLSDEYSEVISYEAGVKAAVSTEGGTVTANYYEHEGTVGAIGTYTTGPDQTLVLQILDGEFGDVIYEAEQTFEYTGYHTIELDEPLDVTSFTVVIHYPDSAPVEGDSYEVDLSSMGGALAGTYEGYYASIDEGQSFIMIGGEWIDMSTEGIEDMLTMRYDTLAEMPAWVDEEIHLSAVPNNACIKVLFV